MFGCDNLFIHSCSAMSNSLLINFFKTWLSSSWNGGYLKVQIVIIYITHAKCKSSLNPWNPWHHRCRIVADPDPVPPGSTSFGRIRIMINSHEYQSRCQEYLGIYFLRNHFFVHINNKLINKQKKIKKTNYSFFGPESDPDPFFPEVDPRIRIQIHIKMKWIRN